jgi:multidrug resistance efflux pump
MDKDKLPPIPTPASQRWREFRIQVIPFVVFIGILVAIVYLWKNYVQPVGVIGAVDTNTVNVTSLQDGMLSELLVERFQSVTAGQDIAVVVNTDPELIKLQIATVQAEMEVMRRRLMVDEDRTVQSFEQMRQELQLQRLLQATERARFFQISNDFVRAKQLLADKSISEANFDAAKAQLDVATAALKERDSLIAERDKRLVDLQPKLRGNEVQPTDAAVLAKAKELEMMLKPVRLKAPISGMISMVHHLKGERILRGSPIVSISDPESRRIVGYIRQPVLEIPTTNDFVRIVTRTQPRKEGRAPILRVGSQLEPINPALLSVDTKRMEVGLPILVGVPDGLRLVPGEYVSLYIEFTR